MSKKLIVGNWKMNPASLEEAKRLSRRIKSVASKLQRTETVACPPFAFIGQTKPRITAKNFDIGAQSASVFADTGAHTGEVSANMLRDIRVKYVIVGHSEQRQNGDTDEIVSKRLSNVLTQGLIAILCVGEKARDEAGEYLNELKKQIEQSLNNIPAKMAGNIIIAYEPVWAIGAKEAMLPEQIYETSLFVKKIFADVFGPEYGHRVRVLYGGSVNFRNAFEIMTVGKVDGLLVGRESVNSPGFVELLKAVDKIS